MFICIFPLQSPSTSAPDGLAIFPSAEVIHLEAGLTLYKSGQYEEALLICDQIISKATPPEISMMTFDEDVILTGLSNSDDRTEMAQDYPFVNSTNSPTIPNIISDNSAKSIDLSSRTTVTSRKRQRDEDLVKGQRSLANKETLTPSQKSNQSKSKHLFIYCSALMLKSQCCRTLNEFAKAADYLDKVLGHLKSVASEDFVSISSDRECLDDGEGSRWTECGPMMKKRKLNEGMDKIYCSLGGERV